MTDWTKLTYAVVDVEGNGQQPPDLVELAVVPIVGGVIGEYVSWLVKPDQPIKHFATRIHGLSSRDVADAPMFNDIAPQVLRALDGAAFVAQNAHVDAGLLARKLGDAWPDPEVFDTLKLARRLLPGRNSYHLGVNTMPLPDELTEMHCWMNSPSSLSHRTMTSPVSGPVGSNYTFAIYRKALKPMTYHGNEVEGIEQRYTRRPNNR